MDVVLHAANEDGRAIAEQIINRNAVVASVACDGRTGSAAISMRLHNRTKNGASPISRLEQFVRGLSLNSCHIENASAAFPSLIL
jgi:hypothetical protein